MHTYRNLANKMPSSGNRPSLFPTNRPTEPSAHWVSPGSPNGHYMPDPDNTGKGSQLYWERFPIILGKDHNCTGEGSLLYWGRNFTTLGEESRLYWEGFWWYCGRISTIVEEGSQQCLERILTIQSISKLHPPPTPLSTPISSWRIEQYTETDRKNRTKW